MHAWYTFNESSTFNMIKQSFKEVHANLRSKKLNKKFEVKVFGIRNVPIERGKNVYKQLQRR